jgi:hypothetical protein
MKSKNECDIYRIKIKIPIKFNTLILSKDCIDNINMQIQIG